MPYIPPDLPTTASIALGTCDLPSGASRARQLDAGLHGATCPFRVQLLGYPVNSPVFPGGPEGVSGCRQPGVFLLVMPRRGCGVVSAADMLLHAYSVDSPLSDDPCNRIERWLTEHVSLRQVKDRCLFSAPSAWSCCWLLVRQQSQLATSTLIRSLFIRLPFLGFEHHHHHHQVAVVAYCSAL